MAATERSADDWRILRALCGYRLVLAPVLAAVFFSGLAPDFVGLRQPALFQAMTYAWFAAGSLLMIGYVARMPAFEHQLSLHLASDLAAVGGLLVASHGISGGLGMLLLVPTLGYAMLVKPRLAALSAALGTLTLFGTELWRQYPQDWNAATLSQAGALGAVLFVVAIAASTVSVRARRSEVRAAQAGSALSDLSRINDTIVTTMRSGVLVVDEALRIRTLNDAARALLPAPGPLMGQDLRQLAPALAADLTRWRSGQSPANPLRVGDRELMLRYTALGRADDAPVLILLEDARRARDEAQRLKLAALGRLSASIAHEIRNPLSAITQATQLLEASRDSEEAASLRNVIERHTARIDGIVRDVLEIGRGQAPDPDSRPLRELLRRAQRHFQEGDSDSARRIRLDMDIDYLDDSTLVHFDSEHFCRILHNIWRNSVQHGAHSVRVRAQPAGGQVLLHIHDDGPGVAAGMAEQIFEPFFTTTTQGTGLGLYLARTLCEANGAQLSLQGEGGGSGAHFVMHIPASTRSIAA